jgi:hypothetical protein
MFVWNGKAEGISLAFVGFQTASKINTSERNAGSVIP